MQCHALGFMVSGWNNLCMKQETIVRVHYKTHAVNMTPARSGLRNKKAMTFVNVEEILELNF